MCLRTWESALRLDPGLVTCKLRLGISSCANAATATNFLGTGLTHPRRMSDEGASVVPFMSLLFFDALSCLAKLSDRFNIYLHPQVLGVSPSGQIRCL